MNSGSGTRMRDDYATIYRELWVRVATALQSHDEDERWSALTRLVAAAPRHWTDDLRLVEPVQPRWWRRLLQRGRRA